MCIFNIHIVDTDVEYYDGRHQHKILCQHEQHKKVKYLEALLEIRSHFMLLVLSMNGGGEKAATNHLDFSLLTKWGRGHLATCVYFRACLSLNLVCSFSFLVRWAWSGKTQQARLIPTDGVD